MAVIAFSKLLSLAAVVTVARAQYWIFGGTPPIVTTRLDPVVSPNSIGGHVHSVVGASRFKEVYDPDDLVQSNCTTIPVQPDKSNYWAPQLYHRDQQTGQLTPIPTSFNIYYLQRPGPLNQPIKAFPKGLRMLAGDTERRSYNASSFADQAISFVCQDFSGAHDNDPDWAERPDFFDHNCPDGMRAEVFFPSCWDGVNLDSSDHKSHLSYPIQNFNSGDCPDSHPVHLVSLFYEMLVQVDQFDYWGPGTWVLANGDTSGYGHHGDFTNGWDVDLLQNALDNCPNANGNVMDCPVLAAVFDQASASACVLETDIVDEEIGFNAPLTILPGCNPLWNGTVVKPACPDPNAPTPALVPAQTPIPTGWTELGCIAEGTSGRALTGASTTSPNMTRAVCAGFCASRGFSLAGAEYSDECYCDNEMRNGATMDLVTWNECTNHCAGNINEICGGPQRLTFMIASNVASSATPSPA
ncbi:WSC-domain-containing protein [Dichomitus squalens LYAD-421 SS1]|uniref:WSC-domain-containing protein n=1 Tax=Dichomitus squalens (strain LYAD-421) TaxID=732165 RepID=R7SQ96_DICSQ|nr:WSC-domain-containing protein [Dichomitus squalens LYAD-421 SS1]EJF58364.1 WSC-domain-containing protein [Dichomitus squalens LYAD-421 SS1]